MSATDPVHQEVVYNNGDWTKSDYKTFTVEELEKRLKQAPFPYQWGVYTTSLARLMLQQAIDFAGDKVVYCDTDSIKTIGKINLDELNKQFKKKALQKGCYAEDIKGKKHICGVFEQDNSYDYFITQGSKRYAYYHNICKCNKCNNYKLCSMGITVAGVTKKVNPDTGFTYACEELGTLENFKVGMIWDKAGGTTAVYNDDDDFYYTDEVTGKSVHITKNVSIVPSTYEMTYSKDYSLLLDEIKLYGEYRESIK